MRKLILFITLFLPLTTLAQNTVTLPTPNGTAFSFQGRYIGTDSLKNIWVYTGNGYNQWYTATQINKLFRTSGSLFNKHADSLFARAVDLYTAQTIGGDKTATGNWIYTGTINVRSGLSYPFVGMSQADGVYSFADANNNVALYRGYLAFSQAGTPSAKTLSIKAPVSISSAGRVQTLQDKDGTIALLGDVPTTGKLDSTYATIDNPSLLKYNYIGGNVNTMMRASVSGWDQRLGEFGNVIKYNGKIYQFYTGYIAPETETNVNIGLQVSSDGGRTWVKGGALGDGKIISRATEDPYCVFDTVTNTAYLFAEDKQDVPFRNIRMWTSPLNDLVTWTDRGDVLDIGAPASWEETDVSSPTVTIKDRNFKLIYEGRGGPNGATQGGAIGLATAPVSLTPTFTKFSGNPILTGTQLNVNSVVSWATAVVPDDIIKNNGKYYVAFHGSNQVFPGSPKFVEGIAVADTSLKNMSDNLGSWLSTSNANDYNGKGIAFSLDSAEYKIYYVDTVNYVVKRAQLTNQTSADFRTKYLSAGSIFTSYMPTDTTSINDIKFRNRITHQEVTRPLVATDVKGIWGATVNNAAPGYVGDFNSNVNTQNGFPYYLMTGTATNAPPNSSASFFQLQNIEFASKNGTGNLTQIAWPYGTGSSANKIFHRERLSGSWSPKWYELIDDSSPQTLSNKILTSPKVNTVSVVGQVLTATDVIGSVAWATPSNQFNGIILNTERAAPNTTDQRAMIYAASGTGTGKYAIAGWGIFQSRPVAGRGWSFFTGATGTERVTIDDNGLSVLGLSAQGGLWYSSSTAGLAAQSAAITGLVKGNGTSAPTVATANLDYTNPAGLVTERTTAGTLNNKILAPANTYQSSTGTTADSISTVSSQRHVSKALVGGNGIGIVQTATSVTISATGNPVVEISGTSQAAVGNTVYIPHNAAITTITVPATTVVGTLYQVIGEGSGGWKLQLPTGAVAVGVGGFTTTSAGSLNSTDRYCTLTIRYAATNKFVVTTSQGTITPL